MIYPFFKQHWVYLFRKVSIKITVQFSPMFPINPCNSKAIIPARKRLKSSMSSRYRPLFVPRSPRGPQGGCARSRSAGGWPFFLFFFCYFLQKVDSFRGCSGGRWCVAFHRMHAYGATGKRVGLSLSLSLGTLSGEHAVDAKTS